MNDLAWLEISKSALKKNMLTLRRLVGREVLVAPAVKGNAYGHGIVGIAKILDGGGADWFSVASIEEAEILRKAGIRKPIMIMGYVPKVALSLALKLNLRFFVFDRASALYASKTARRLGKTARLHLKVDTGMSRQGILLDQVEDFMGYVSKLSNLKIEGIATHFANSDQPHHSFFAAQLKKFRLLKNLPSLKRKKIIFHCANSAALLTTPESYLDMVRPGLAVYGLYPSVAVRQVCLARGVRIYPALSFKTRVIQVKEIPANSYVGYGLTRRLKRRSRIAILPAGYYDGLDRKLSNKGHVLVKGVSAPIIGRVSMDLTIVDISRIPSVKVADEAVIIGQQGKRIITAEMIAEDIDSINYEVTTRLREGLERIYV